MASQPTPLTYPPKIRPYKGLINHWLPLKSHILHIKPLFLKGGEHSWKRNTPYAGAFLRNESNHLESVCTATQQQQWHLVHGQILNLPIDCVGRGPGQRFGLDLVSSVSASVQSHIYVSVADREVSKKHRNSARISMQGEHYQN